MIKKLLSKKGSSTLTVSLILLILLSSLAIITTLIMGRNSEITLNKINQNYEIILLENDLYDVLNETSTYEELKDYSYSNESVYSVKTEIIDKNLLVILVSIESDKYIVKALCEFNFENDSYKVLSWEKDYVRENS